MGGLLLRLEFLTRSLAVEKMQLGPCQSSAFPVGHYRSRTQVPYDLPCSAAAQLVFQNNDFFDRTNEERARSARWPAGMRPRGKGFGCTALLGRSMMYLVF